MAESLYETLCKDLLGRADEALTSGQTGNSEVLASQVVANAMTRADEHTRALAELTLARSDLLASRFEQAMTRGSYAASQLTQPADEDAWAAAQCIRSYAAGCLGQHLLALKWAEEGAVSITKDSAPSSASMRMNYLGCVQLMAGKHRDAHESLDAAAWLALDCDKPTARMAPFVNKAHAYVIEISAAWELPPAQIRALLAVLGDVHRINSVNPPAPATLHGSSPALGQTLIQFVTAAGLSLADEFDQAAPHLVSCASWLSQMPLTSWTRTLPWWAAGIWFRKQGDAHHANLCLAEMETAARVSGHVPLTGIAQSLRKHLRASMGTDSP